MESKIRQYKPKAKNEEKLRVFLAKLSQTKKDKK